MSMGGAASLLPEEPLSAQAFVLEQVYPTIDAALSNRLRLHLGIFASAFAPLLRAQMAPRLGVSPKSLRPIDRIGSVRAPILLIAGSADRHTTLAESQALFERALQPKEFWVVQGAAHVDLYAFAPREYAARVLGFFRRWLRAEAA
jgi:fermentation-respiration switch protein FrsA (DUF1100 family)